MATEVLRLATGLLAFLFGFALYSDCGNDDVGIPALTDMTTDYAIGYPGGLYGGTNDRPSAHELVGMSQSSLVVPRLSNGTPGQSGKIGFVGLGMSNAEQLFIAFRQQCLADTTLNPRVRYVEACQFGQTLDLVADPDAPYWTVNLPAALSAAGCTAAQVQVAYIFEALRFPANWGGFPAHVEIAAGFWVDLLHNAKAVFPNLRIAYLDSLQFMGYAQQKSVLEEPFAFEQAFAVRQVIQDQIDGDSDLDLSIAPWISWALYNWNNGVVQRSDGLDWLCPQDCAGDGIHLTFAGGSKLASRLRATLKADPTCTGWFLKP